MAGSMILRTVETEEMMDRPCIGDDNKDKIQNIEFKIQLLDKELEHVKTNMVTFETLHKLQLEIGDIKSAIREMQNNRSEDRESIADLKTSLNNLNDRIEDYIKGNAQIMISQSRIETNSDKLGESIEAMSKTIELMHEKIEMANFANQLKTFYNKSKLNKWLLRFAVVMLTIFVVAVFTFFFNGGRTTFFDILKGIKELIS